jgi:hypothetical protein
MILWNNSKDTLTNKKRTTINSRIPRDHIRELNESSTHTRSSHLSHMVALIIEEALDQCSVADELLRISRWFQDHIGPVVAVEERGSTEDMKTSSAAVSTWRDEIHPRWEVRSWITGVIGHW